MKKISLILVLFMAVLMANGNMSNFAANPFNNSDSLVAFYSFNGNANDESDNGNDGTIHGAILTQDRFGNTDKAFRFNGTSDDITVLHHSSLQLTNEITITAWVKRTRYGIDMILEKGGDWTGGTCNYGLSLHSINNNMFYFFFNGGWRGTDGVSDFEWHHYAVVAKQGDANPLLYIDGESRPVQYSNGVSSIDLTPTTEDLHIGSQLGTYPYYGANNIDEVKIYNRLLSAEEISLEYNTSLTCLVAFYPFNGNANDESGNGHDGSINGNSTLTSDRFMTENRAFTFPDQSSNISLANSSNLNFEDGFSINAWVKYKNTYAVIVGKHICGYVNGYVLGIDYDGQMQLWLANSVWSTVRTNYTFVENQWYMITASYDAGTGSAKIYVNGEIRGSGNVTYNNFSSYPISIGEAYQNNCQPATMSGAVDEVKIYSRPLSEAEILTEYNSSQVGLVAFYPLNGNTNDESGNGNHGTMIGTLTSTADRYGTEGKAYKFWHPDYISVPTNPLFFTNEFTVSYWYKVASYYGERGVISCVGNNGGYQQYFVGTNFAYLIGYNFPNGNSFFSSNYTVSDAPNTWHHVTTTYQKTGENSSVTKFYINGELMKTDNQPVAIAYPGEEKFNIGKNVDVNFNGELDDIRIYSKALTDQEIRDLFLTETKPVLLHPVNQSSVTTLTPEMLWSSPLSNAEFKFQLSSASLFGTILHELVTTDLKTQIPEALLMEGQNYYWRVQSTLNGETGPWSPVWSFNFVNTGLAKLIREDVSFRISPNPADASVKIIYSLPETATHGTPVTLEIANSMGKCIKTLAEKNALSGNNEIEVETGSLASGIYYCRLKAGNISIVRKLVIIQ